MQNNNNRSGKLENRALLTKKIIFTNIMESIRYMQVGHFTNMKLGTLEEQRKIDGL